MIKYLSLLFLIFQNAILTAQATDTELYNSLVANQNLQLSDIDKEKLFTEIKNITSKNKDSVKIWAIEPHKDLVHGNIYNLKVIVVYNLVSKDQGQLQIGFNNGLDENRYNMIRNANKILDKKNGYHIFEVKTRVVNWKQNGGNFNAYVNISEYPHGNRYTPLCSNHMPIKSD